MNKLALTNQFADRSFKEAFAKCYRAREFLRQAFCTPDFRVPPNWDQQVVLTSQGDQVVEAVRRQNPDLGLLPARLSVFLRFYHQDLFVDVAKTQADPLLAYLGQSAIQGSLLHPWVFGRTLYDRFYDTQPVQTETLTVAETALLLKDTPRGVFQLGPSILGPWGILNSDQHRHLPPTLSVPLWHCSDPSCPGFHVVGLSQGASDFHSGLRLINAHLRESGEPSSEWAGYYRDLASSGKEHYDDSNSSHLVRLLGDAYSKTELRILVRALLDRYPKRLREALSSSPHALAARSANSATLANALQENECLQLALVSSDESIVAALDSIVQSGEITVPPTEIRHSPIVPKPGRGWLRVAAETSRLGVRFVSSRMQVAHLRLRQLISQVYAEEDRRKQLEWKLRFIPGSSVQQRLDSFLHTEDPRRILRDLVLNDYFSFSVAMQKLRFCSLAPPQSPDEELLVIERILWKLGFKPQPLPDHNSAFWRRLDTLRKALPQSEEIPENLREAVRGVASNFFVSLEEYLDLALCFSAWALLGDHYAGGRFSCNFSEARRFMAKRLNEAQASDKEHVRFDENGKNTLFPLIRGFSILAAVCKSVVDKAETYLRPDDGLPGYHYFSKLEEFPLLHTAMILDINNEEQSISIRLLGETTSKLEKAEVAGVRNRLEHKRPDFPGRSEIEKVCVAIEDALLKLEAAGLSPVTYWPQGSKHDAYGRGQITLRNYRGAEVEIPTPSVFPSLGMPSLSGPVAVLPAIHIGESNEILCFRVEEPSDFQRLWDKYPLRKHRGPSVRPSASEDFQSGDPGPSPASS